jgi:hypothetical protein
MKHLYSISFFLIIYLLVLPVSYLLDQCLCCLLLPYIVEDIFFFIIYEIMYNFIYIIYLGNVVICSTSTMYWYMYIYMFLCTFCCFLYGLEMTSNHEDEHVGINISTIPIVFWGKFKLGKEDDYMYLKQRSKRTNIFQNCAVLITLSTIPYNTNYKIYKLCMHVEIIFISR